MSDDIDLEALLQEAEEVLPSKKPAATNTYQNKLNSSGQVKKGSINEVDLSIREFDKTYFENPFENEPSKIYEDPNYYKTCLAGEGQASQRLHQLLVKYLNCQDKKDKTVYRQQIVSSYWEFLRSLSPKMVSSAIPMPKKMAMRYGIVLPSLFSPEQKDFFSRVKIDNPSGEPVLYMDEWLKEISKGQMKPSTTDEVPNRSKGPAADQQRLVALKSKNSGKLQSADNMFS